MGSGGRDGRDNAFIAAGGVAMLTASGTAVITLYVNRRWSSHGHYLVRFGKRISRTFRVPGQPAYVYWDGATYGPKEARDWPYQRRFSGPVNPNEVPGWHPQTGDVWERDA